MRIGFLIPSLAVGGAERATVALGNCMAHMGHEVFIITLHDGENFYDADGKIRIFPLAFKEEDDGKIKKSLKKAYNLRRVLKNIGLDVIIAMSSLMAAYGVFACAFTGTKSIGSERSNPYRHYPDFPFSAIKKLAALMSDGYVFQTQAASQYYPKKAVKKGIVIPNGIFGDIPDEVVPFDMREKKIYAMGRLAPEKGFDVLLKAFALFSEKHSDYTLTVFGEGKLHKDLEELAESLGVSQKVSFPGADKAACEKMSGGRMFVLSSRFEGMPNVLIEAMACGMPVIAANCPMGPSELITNVENGILVKVDDVEGLAAAMCELAEDDFLSQRLSENALKTREKLSQEKITEKWLQYASEVIEK